MQIVTDVRAILGDRLWEDGFGDTRLVLTFGFAETLPDHQSDQQTAAFRQSFTPLDAAARDVARDAIGQWDDASALTLVEVAADEADILFGAYDFSVSADKQGVDGFAFFPNNSRLAGDVFIDEGSDASLALYLHEIGHALGLEHPFEGDFLLPENLDTRTTTVMSSTGQGTGALTALDIEAIQMMYGPPEDSPPPVIPEVGFSNAFVNSATVPGALEAGQERSLNLSLDNAGEDAFGGPSVGAIVLSTDRVLDAGDIRIGEAVYGDQAPDGAPERIAIDVVVPEDIPGGAYFLGYVADADNDIAETNETDNVFFLDPVFTIENDVAPPPTNSAPEALASVFAFSEGFFLDDQLLATDADGDALTFTLVADAANGAVEIASDGAFTYRPDDGFTGDDMFTFRVSDGEATDEATATVSVLEVNDQLDDGPDRFDGGAGDDVADGLGGDDTLTGGAGDDELRGGAGADVVFGDDGADRLFGDAGEDALFGGRGADRISGNGAADVIEGGNSIDKLFGGAGADRVEGGGGRDRILGGGGTDTVAGGAGRDLVRGDNGADRVTGGRGADKLLGGQGADTLIGGLGADTLSGGDGADLFIFLRFSGSDRINGFEQGLDRLSIDTAGALADLRFDQVGNDVLITHLRGEILVKGQSVADFSEADFLF